MSREGICCQYNPTISLVLGSFSPPAVSFHRPPPKPLKGVVKVAGGGSGKGELSWAGGGGGAGGGGAWVEKSKNEPLGRYPPRKRRPKDSGPGFRVFSSRGGSWGFVCKYKAPL